MTKRRLWPPTIAWLDVLTGVVGLAALALMLQNILPGDRTPSSATLDATDVVALPVLSAEELAKVRTVPGLVIGPGDAPVVMEIFFSYTCGYCLQWAETVALVRAEFPQHMALRWRHYVPNASTEQQSLHLAAECAADQDRFRAYHDAVVSALQKGTASGEPWALAGEAAGLEGSAFRDCVRSGRHVPALRAAADLGEQLAVDGTPISFVEGVRIDGAVPAEALRAVVTQRLNAKRLALQSDES